MAQSSSNQMVYTLSAAFSPTNWNESKIQQFKEKIEQQAQQTLGCEVEFNLQRQPLNQSQQQS